MIGFWEQFCLSIPAWSRQPDRSGEIDVNHCRPGLDNQAAAVGLLAIGAVEPRLSEGGLKFFLIHRVSLKISPLFFNKGIPGPVKCEHVAAIGIQATAREKPMPL